MGSVSKVLCVHDLHYKCASFPSPHLKVSASSEPHCTPRTFVPLLWNPVKGFPTQSYRQPGETLLRGDFCGLVIFGLYLCLAASQNSHQGLLFASLPLKLPITSRSSVDGPGGNLKVYVDTPLGALQDLLGILYIQRKHFSADSAKMLSNTVITRHPNTVFPEPSPPLRVT